MLNNTFTEAVVVGAGAAGIASAYVLQKNAIKCVIIEAQPNIGGRVVTLTMDNENIDTGASW